MVLAAELLLVRAAQAQGGTSYEMLNDYFTSTHRKMTKPGEEAQAVEKTESTEIIQNMQGKVMRKIACPMESIPISSMH